MQDGQGSDARENEIENIQDPRSKSSQQSSKLAGMSKRSGTRGEVSQQHKHTPSHYITKCQKLGAEYTNKPNRETQQQQFLHFPN